jgi:uncharacterized OB-fold protein
MKAKPLPRSIAIVGAGMCKFGAFPDKASRNNPYVTGIVELDEGVRISARILGLEANKPDQIKIGTPLTVAFLERGEGQEKKTFLAFRV